MSIDTRVHHLNQREVDGVDDGVSDNPRDFQKGGLPQLCEHGDSIGQTQKI